MNRKSTMITTMINSPAPMGKIEEALASDRTGHILNQTIEKFRQEAHKIQSELRKGASPADFTKAEHYLAALTEAEASLTKHWQKKHKP